MNAVTNVRETNTVKISDSWLSKEDSWAIIIALGVVLLTTLAFLSGTHDFFVKMGVNIAPWSTSITEATAKLPENGIGLLYLYLFFTLVFSYGAKYLQLNVPRFIAGFTGLFVLSIVVTFLGSNTFIKSLQLETPILALFIGLLLGNTVKLPAWFQPALRTEYYVKTGIILMGATLPFTILLKAGPAAIGQALIVSVATFGSIYFAATKIFKLDQRFAAVLGAGGSICGVSASIAIGGACRAKKEHVSVAISLVIVWAVAMIFFLPAVSKMLGLAPGIAGAWIGTSEFADAAGFAAAEAFGDERAVKTFTLMKVVGRDMFVGIWAFLTAVLSVTLWENKNSAAAERIDKSEIWRRFPKFIVGFFIASLFTTLVLVALSTNSGAQYSKDIIGAIKSLRGWIFTWTFQAIGFTTRFRELTTFGWKPLAAFTIGVLINIPLGYFLSTTVFASYWLGVK